MTAVGGSIESINIRGREFAVTADAEVNRKLGGYENTVEPNGDFTSRIIKTVVTGMLTGLVIEIDDSRGDQEFLQDVANGDDFVPTVINYASGLSYQGSAIPVGEINYSNQTAAATLDMAAGTPFTRQ